MDGKKCVVIGGTGLIGSQCIDYISREKDLYKEIVVLVRHLPEKICEIENVIYRIIDFDKQKTYEKYLNDANDFICAIGTTIKKAGSKDKFQKVDFQYPVEIAKIAHANGCNRAFIISALGANPKSIFSYNRTKGMLERTINSIGFQTVFVFRPSLLLGTRKEFRAGEEVAKKVLPCFSSVLPRKYQPVESRVVAASIALMARSKDIGLNVIESHQIQALYANALETGILKNE
jgi:uncharacterized protein YbjT (DUF2867 family)